MMLLGVAGRSNEAKKVKKNRHLYDNGDNHDQHFYQTLSPIHLPNKVVIFFSLNFLPRGPS
jgi:hypothetical protein